LPFSRGLGLITLFWVRQNSEAQIILFCMSEWPFLEHTVHENIIPRTWYLILFIDRILYQNGQVLNVLESGLSNSELCLPRRGSARNKCRQFSFLFLLGFLFLVLIVINTPMQRHKDVNSLPLYSTFSPRFMVPWRRLLGFSVYSHI